MSSYLDFLKDDIETGLLKNKRVGMKVRTLKRINGEDISGLTFLPVVGGFVVLNVCDRFMIKDMKGGIKKE